MCSVSSLCLSEVAFLPLPHDIRLLTLLTWDFQKRGLAERCGFSTPPTVCAKNCMKIADVLAPSLPTLPGRESTGMERKNKCEEQVNTQRILGSEPEKRIAKGKPVSPSILISPRRIRSNEMMFFGVVRLTNDLQVASNANRDVHTFVF